MIELLRSDMRTATVDLRGLLPALVIADIRATGHDLLECYEWLERHHDTDIGHLCR